MATRLDMLHLIEDQMLWWLLLQVTVVAMGTYVVIWLAARATPSARVTVCLLGLACLTALPVVAISRLSAWSWGEWLPRTASLLPKNSDANSAGQTNNEAANTSATTADATAGSWEQALVAAADLFARNEQPAVTRGSNGVKEEISGETSQNKNASMIHWLVVLLGLSVAIGSARLLLGMWLVHRLRRQASPLDDPTFEAEVDACALQLGVPAGVSIAVSNTIGSPAVIGWRSPLLLLPKTWDSWTADERRAVVAHELAHVARCDYLLTSLAQMAVAIHFFHPVVHALVSRLRLDQELAADGIAARLVGGPQRYVEILAGLALRQPEVRTPGPAQALLPTRQTFVRRLEMLRFQNFNQRRWGGWYLAAGSAVVLGLAVLSSGLQPIAVAQEAAAPQQSGATAAVLSADLLDMIPPAIIEGVVDLNVAKLVTSDAVKPLLEGFPDLNQQLGFDLQSLERALVLIPSLERNPDNPLVVMQFRAGTELPVLEDSKRTGRGTPADIFAANSRKINDRTLVVGGTEPLRAIIGTLPTDNRFQPLVGRYQGQPIRIAGQTRALRRILSTSPMRNDSPMWAFAPLWNKVDTLSLGIDVGDELQFKGQLDTSDPTRIAETLSALKVLGENLLTSLGEASRSDGEQDPTEWMLMTAMMGQAAKLLQSITIETQDASVQVSAQVDSAVYAANAVLLPALQASRKAAVRVGSANNLKQLMLALHNYESTYTCFPPAVIRDPETGVERSWRVEILPFLDGGLRLYEQYRKDEPWDSPANLKVLEQMPKVFAMPGMGGTETPYLAVVSPDGGLTMTKNGKPPQLADITDGLSDTVFLVETKPMVPWTKPADAADMEAARTTTMHTGGFNMAQGDGAVKFISNTINEHLWTALTTRSGGEVIQHQY